MSTIFKNLILYQIYINIIMFYERIHFEHMLSKSLGKLFTKLVGFPLPGEVCQLRKFADQNGTQCVIVALV